MLEDSEARIVRHKTCRACLGAFLGCPVEKAKAIKGFYQDGSFKGAFATGKSDPEQKTPNNLFYTSLHPTTLFGMRMHIKPGQVAAAWLFQDGELAQKYLNEEIAEAELEALARQETQRRINRWANVFGGTP